jgi:hypothetical protein
MEEEWEDIDFQGDDDKKYLRMYLEPFIKKPNLTKEQWKIAYWKLRRKYRQENLQAQLNFK